MKKSKFILAIALVICVALLAGGGTLALFSASEDASATITAAQLQLNSKRDNYDPVPGPMFYVTPQQGATPTGELGLRPTGLWVPGDSVRRTLIIENPETSIDAYLTSVKATLSADSVPSLAEQYTVQLKFDRGAGEEVVAQAPLTAFLAGPVPLQFSDGTKIDMPKGTSGGPTTGFLHFTLAFNSTAGNEYQDGNMVVNFTVNAEQKAHNP